MKNRTHYHFAKINGVNIFYREAGPIEAPVLLLLHGYPTSSHMYRNLINDLSDPIKALWKDRNDQEAIKKCQAFHSLEGLKWQYTHSVPDVCLISPDNWELDLRHLLRPENDDIQIQMFYDYRNNVKQYPKWQEYLRTENPEMLIVYGKDDYIFPGIGAEAFKRDVKNLEFHLYPTGHFALESFGDEIAATIKDFLDRKVGVMKQGKFRLTIV
jgi:pimeloyl-ACP methyl ester carboxylesterase